jgi:drug/metabolite transporter (DMT)-like permease
MESFYFGLLFAIVSMFGFGVYQFFVNKNVKNINIYSSLIYVHLALIFSILPILFFNKLVIPDIKIILLILFTSFVGALNIPFLYKAIKAGKLSLVIPIANTYSLFAVIFSFLFFGESLKWSQYISGAVILVGMFFIVTKRKEIKELKINKNDIKPLTYAIIFSAGLGLYSVLLRPIEQSIGPYIGFFYTELAIVIFLLLYGLKKNIHFQKPETKMYKFLFLAGFFQAIGGLFFFFGIKYISVSLTSIVGAANPLITMILAFTFLKERVEWNQLLGIIITITGLIGIVL